MLRLVVPAYNEEANIGRLIEEIDAFFRSNGKPYRLLIVDDGSRDRTAEIVRKKSERFPCELISYSPNRGVDEAFRRGLRCALEPAGDDDRIVTLEADGTADLLLLETFEGKIRNGADVAVASYYARGGSLEGTAFHRRILSRAANIFTRVFFRVPGITCYSSFYRMYRPSALRAVLKKHGDFFDEKGFACVVELLVRVHRLGLRVEEAPMVLLGSKRVGKSKMKIGQTVLGYLRIVKRIVILSPPKTGEES